MPGGEFDAREVEGFVDGLMEAQKNAHHFAGAVVVKPKGLPGALTYDVRYGVVVNGSMPPAAWTTLILPGSKKLTISNLTPGATYAFQVRAF